MSNAAPTLESLTKDFNELQSDAKKLREENAKLKAAPNWSGVHRDAEGRVVSYWEDTDESVDVAMVAGRSDRDIRSGNSMKSAIRRTGLKSLNREYGYVPRSEFKSWNDLIRHGFEHNGTEAFNRRMEAHMKAFKAVQGMSTQEGAAAGYTVMPEFANGIIERVYSNNLLAATDGYNVQGNSMTFLVDAETSRATGSRHGGVQGYWLGEGATVTKSKPTLREVNLKLKKLGVLVYLTQELIDDGGFALEQRINKVATEEFQFMIGDAITNGTGAGQPLGYLNAPSLITISKETNQPADTLMTENIEKMYSRFFMPNLGSANWYHNQDILPQLNTMTIGVGTGGQPVFLPPGGLSAAPYGSLKGRPLQPTEFNPTLGDVGDLALCDLGQMLSITKGGVVQAVSMHVEFLTDQLAIRLTMRIDVRPWESAPLTPYKGTNTQSSFVALEAR